jgi:hypothetical protein
MEKLKAKAAESDEEKEITGEEEHIPFYKNGLIEDL